MIYLYAVGCLIFVLGILLLILGTLFHKKKSFCLKKHKEDKYAILIPARDESKVIENLLKSIQIQNKDMSNVYVIVEEKKDPTCKITKKYGANIFVRTKPIRARKGYAIDECIHEILKKEHYDLYFIFDADNILDKNFISNMLKAWHQGYDIAIGYRNILNPKNIVSSCSGFMFILFNNLINKNVRMRIKQPIMLSGTGLYISGDLIEKWKGFPFYTLTEDYELSVYMYEHNIASTYVESAIYYDEQPLDMRISIKQRTRWVKGFFEKRKGILKDEPYSFSTKLGVIPIVLIIIGFIFLFLVALLEVICSLINGLSIGLYIWLLVGIPLWIYVLLWLSSCYVLIKENDRIALPSNLKIPCLFFSPLFLMGFIVSFLRSICKKEIKWEKVPHCGK